MITVFKCVYVYIYTHKYIYYIYTCIIYMFLIYIYRYVCVHIIQKNRKGISVTKLIVNKQKQWLLQ